MGISALWYVGVFAAVIVVLRVVFKAEEMDVAVTLTSISNISGRIYMIMLGIACPLVYFPRYIAVGVTRKRFALGIFASGALLSLCFFAALRIPLLAWGGGLSLLAVLIPALYGALAFLIGWTASVGFQYTRGAPILVGIVCACAILAGVAALERLGLRSWPSLSIAVCAIGLVGLPLLRAVMGIPVRC
jgi:hypothetical protein